MDGLAGGETYYWRVAALFGEHGQGSWSEPWTFGTAPVSMKFFYYLKDHLGSVRATVNGHGNVVHYDDYYPFGLQMPERTYISDAPLERYTGHELDSETGHYYAGGRYYPSLTGVWPSRDPLTHMYPSLSSYSYASNNPLNIIDPDGLYLQYVDANGNTVVEAEEGDNFETFMVQYGLSESEAREWFQTHGLRDYLPSKREGLWGWILGPSYPTLESGTALISKSGILRLNYDAATPKQRFNQLLFAFDYVRNQGIDWLNLTDFFSVDQSRTGVYGRLSGTVNIEGSSIGVTVSDFPLTTSRMNNILLSPDYNQVIIRGKTAVENLTFHSYNQRNISIDFPRRAMLIQLAPEHAILFSKRYGFR